MKISLLLLTVMSSPNIYSGPTGLKNGKMAQQDSVYTFWLLGVMKEFDFFFTDANI